MGSGPKFPRGDPGRVLSLDLRRALREGRRGLGRSCRYRSDVAEAQTPPEQTPLFVTFALRAFARPRSSAEQLLLCLL